jgi:menaquinone-dependent protoporphyrinogen IX oxidase
MTAMLMAGNISFEAVDDSSARVTLHDHGRTATATLFFDTQGRLTDLVAKRYRTADSSDPETWSTPVTGHGEFEGLRLPGPRQSGLQAARRGLRLHRRDHHRPVLRHRPGAGTEGPMKVLVRAASKYGAASEIGQAAADVLAERGCEVTVLPPEKVSAVQEFDAVVLGSAVYLGQWMKPGRELAERYAGALAARPVWLFSSGPVGEPAKPAGDPSAISAQEGDFRNWAEIRGWATSIADALLS